MDLDYPSNPKKIKYRSIKIYKTKERDVIQNIKHFQRYVLVGFDTIEHQYSIISLLIYRGNEKHAKNLSDVIREDLHRFSTWEETKTYLLKNFKDCIFITEAKGLVGFIRFLQGFYLIIFKKTKPVAKLGSILFIQYYLKEHKIFEISGTEMISIFEMHPQTQSIEERYLKEMKEYDLDLGFYSSYTYDLTQSFNRNIIKNWLDDEEKRKEKDDEADQKASKMTQDMHLTNKRRARTYSAVLSKAHVFTRLQDIGEFQNIFLWNKFVLTDFDHQVHNKKWIMPIIHGYCDQISQIIIFNQQTLAIKTTTNLFSICLIARRSIHHAGARYLTRGINEEGFVANYVETEQIVIDLDKPPESKPACSSFIQVRGSAPVYWYQQSNLLIPKPPIKINISDPYLMATKKHLADLVALYGHQIFLVNLVKSIEHIPRESTLAEEFLQSLQSVKEDLQQAPEIEVGYLHYDMKAQLKQQKSNQIIIYQGQRGVCKQMLLLGLLLLDEEWGFFTSINGQTQGFSYYRTLGWGNQIKLY